MSKYYDMVSKLKRIPIYVDIDTLDLYCELLLNDRNKALNYSNLSNLRDYIQCMDLDILRNDDAKMGRYYFIKEYLAARIDHGITSRKLILKYIETHTEPRYYEVIRKEILGGIIPDTLSTNDIKFINDMIYTQLSLKFLHKYKVGLQELIEDLNSDNFIKTADSCTATIEFMQNMLSELTQAQRRSRQDNRLNLLNDEVLTMKLYEASQKLLSESDLLLTRWQGLNKLLGGGFVNARIYNFIGATGGFKSGLLLNIMKSIKLANKGRPHKDPTKRPTILFVSQENNIWETVHRIFNIFSTVQSIKKFKPEEIVKMIKEGGFRVCDDKDDINVEFRYGTNMEYSVNDLRGMVEELENSGQEVICIIQDYIERLRPPYMSVDTRVRLIDVSNQLHDLAMELDIPIITGSQLNKEGNGIIEEMRQMNASSSMSTDIGKRVSMKHISESFGMLKNFDYNIVIVVEYDSEEERFYLSANKQKERGSSETEDKLSFVLLPFVGKNSSIQLMDDMDASRPLYRTTLIDPEALSPEITKAKKERKKPRETKDLFDTNSRIFDTIDCGEENIFGRNNPDDFILDKERIQQVVENSKIDKSDNDSNDNMVITLKLKEDSPLRKRLYAAQSIAFSPKPNTRAFRVRTNALFTNVSW